MAARQMPAPDLDMPVACNSDGRPEHDPSRILHQKFEVQKLLGQGSYGKVYRCKRRSDGKLYAVKARARRAQAGQHSPVQAYGGRTVAVLTV